MKRLDVADIKFDNASYIDPTGRVFYWDRGIYRGFYPEVSAFYRQLLSSDRMGKLISEGNIVKTEIEPNLLIDGFDLVVKHERIEYLSYCFEWASNMLREAAILTLELALNMCEDNIVLQDASPFNIFFQGARPVFIDLGSFTQPKNNYLWGAYQQFCNFFLFPLYLYSSGNPSVARALLMDCINGVAAEDVMKSVGTLNKTYLPGYFSRLFLPETTRKFSGKLRYTKEVDSLYSRLSKNLDVSRLRKSFLKRLYSDVTGIKLPKPSGTWSAYYESTDKETLELKKRELWNILAKLRPESVLDIGCNAGVFSILAAEAGAKTVSIDSDHDCISALFETSKEKHYNILPLVLNILNPSPSIGWCNAQHPSAPDRLKCDMVFALALIHHLVFSGGQDFERAIKSIKGFQKKWCVIEYVDKNDPMACLLLRRPAVDYGWYTFENFMSALMRNYREVTVLRRLSETRALILAAI